MRLGTAGRGSWPAPPLPASPSRTEARTVPWGYAARGEGAREGREAAAPRHGGRELGARRRRAETMPRLRCTNLKTELSGR